MTREEAIEELEYAKIKLREANVFPSMDTAIDMAIEALKDRPKGEWVKKTFGYGECSECGCIVGNRFVSNFCPNCGSDMRGRSEDE